MSISPIIEVNELFQIYNNPEVLIFDVSNSKNAKLNYDIEHLEGAIFVDLNTQLADIKEDYSNGGRHPLPPIEIFAETLTELGISKNSHVIIYDDKNGSNAAARFWWMLRSVGHEKVQVLNGGLNEAKKGNFPLSDRIKIINKSIEKYTFDQWLLPTANIDEVEKVSQDGSFIVVDVRSKERYEGTIEPLDLIAGHIPGAINIPFTENLDDNGLFLKPGELRKKHETALDQIKTDNIIIHCGSGVTACHTLLALAYAEMEIPKLYVGSWSEWSRNNKVVEKTEI